VQGQDRAAGCFEAIVCRLKMTRHDVFFVDAFIGEKRYAALVFALCWLAIGMLSPAAPLICLSKSRNLLPNRTSANS